MGCLRTIFAISVVFVHSWGHVFVGGRNAVQLFYIISGFLISYVLVESRKYPFLKDFYINRALRLYPIYSVVAFSTLVALFMQYIFIDMPSLFKVWDESPLSAKVLLLISNIFLFGQDWVMFSAIKDGHLIFSENFQNSEVLLAGGLLVPQAWTLGVELTFYLIAPFVVSSRKVMYLLLIDSIALRLTLIKIGIGMNDPWNYRFFPTELALFLVGALSHQILYPLYKKVFVSKIDLVSNLSTYFLIIFSLFFFVLPIPGIYKNLFLFASFALLLPFTFVFNNKNKWDRYIGDLSYPIYIGHMLVIIIVTNIMSIFPIHDKKIFAFICVFFSILFAVFLNKCIGIPVEKIRNRFRSLRSAGIQLQ